MRLTRLSMKRETTIEVDENRATKRGRTEVGQEVKGKRKMRKVVIRAPGGYDNLEIEETEIPVPQAGEALVEVVAIGVNYADVCVRLGVYESAKKVGTPGTLF